MVGYPDREASGYIARPLATTVRAPDRITGLWNMLSVEMVFAGTSSAVRPLGMLQKIHVIPGFNAYHGRG